MNVTTRRIAMEPDSLYLSAYSVMIDGEEIGEVRSWETTYTRRCKTYMRPVWFVGDVYAYTYDTKREAVEALLESRA